MKGKGGREGEVKGKGRKEGGRSEVWGKGVKGNGLS